MPPGAACLIHEPAELLPRGPMGGGVISIFIGGGGAATWTVSGWALVGVSIAEAACPFFPGGPWAQFPSALTQEGDPAEPPAPLPPPRLSGRSASGQTPPSLSLAGLPASRHPGAQDMTSQHLGD